MSMSTSLQFKIKLCNIQQQITSKKRWWKLLFNHNSWNISFKMSNAFFMTFLLLERSLLKITAKIVCILFLDCLWRVMNYSKSEHPLSPMKHRWISSWNPCLEIQKSFMKPNILINKSQNRLSQSTTAYYELWSCMKKTYVTKTPLGFWM
jgi:hypothetical protein